MDLACYFPRTANYESINGENLKGWHQADGMTYLENANWNQYNDTFWATVNSQRLPGITVTAGANPAEGQRNGNMFAGGVDLRLVRRGRLHPPTRQRAIPRRQQGVVHLRRRGGLPRLGHRQHRRRQGRDDHRRKLSSSGNNAFTVGGAVQPTAWPWSSTQNGVSWMHLAGSVAGADIGSYFPGGANLDFTREARTGSWSAIVVRSTASVTDNYLTVGNSHGTNPTAGSYAYVLLSNYTPPPRRRRSWKTMGRPRPCALPNWARAARCSGRTAPAFVASDKKAIVTVQDLGSGQLLLLVSDPTQANIVGINVEIGARSGRSSVRTRASAFYNCSRR